MGKSISKAFKKVVGGTLGAIGLGAQDAPTPKAPEATAAPVEVAQDVAPEETTETTASGEKKTKRIGKRGLQVSRTSGGGVSI